MIMSMNTQKHTTYTTLLTNVLFYYVNPARNPLRGRRHEQSVCVWEGGVPT